MGKQIPHSKLVVHKKSGSRAICEKCKKPCRVRNIINMKGKYVCTNCRHKTISYKAQSSASNIGKGLITIEQVLEKKHTVKRYDGGCSISLPMCMTGKKVKLIIVEEEDAL